MLDESKAYLIRTYVTDGTYTYNLYRNDELIASNQSNTTYSTQLNNNDANYFSVKTNYYGGETEASNKVGFAKGNVTVPNLNIRDIDLMTVTENSILTVSGTLSNENTANLVLEDGSQLINNSNGVQATVKKSITPYTQDGGWHLLASPITDNVTPTVDNGLLANEYDLYTFDQSQDKEWRNYKAGAFTSLESGKGYLYANSGNPTLTFTGTLAANVESTPLTYNTNATFKGFNLIGNPYPCNAYVDRSFFVMNEDASDFTLGSNPIPPCTAILVQAQGADESVTFSKTASKNEIGIAIAVTAANTRSNSVIDKAMVSFNSDNRLVKYNLRENTSKLYIPQNGQAFAVAFTDGESEMPLNFKASNDGVYTLNFEIENLELNYLHLIDNITGNDVNLLTTPSYSFEANTTDYDSRFKLLFAPICNDADGDNETFAFINDGNIIIKNAGDASLQIVDMMGRVVLEEAINHVSTSEMAPGVYVLRLINGEKVKTQKIVIE